MRELGAFDGLCDRNVLGEVGVGLKVADGHADDAAFVVLGYGSSLREDVRHVAHCCLDEADGRPLDALSDGLVVDGDSGEVWTLGVLEHVLAHLVDVAWPCEGHLVTGLHDGLLLRRHGDRRVLGCGRLRHGHGGVVLVHDCGCVFHYLFLRFV
ncbi:MAG: hypothetical protein IKS96_07045 [Fibrobacter sp.]|nr:hypothetical protein [Fibrobacter sp.]MBR6449683.1 hypothetical protein [Fibrobacter sp.]